MFTPTAVSKLAIPEQGAGRAGLELAAAGFQSLSHFLTNGFDLLWLDASV